jgi:muconate cycloisomerase
MRSFEHASASRTLAEAVVVRLELSDGSCGWGETLPRPYVTGETIGSVVEDLAASFWPVMAGRPVGPDLAAGLPATGAGGRCAHAAACAVDLAIADASFDPTAWERLSEAVSAEPTSRAGSRLPARVSGVLGSADPAKTSRRLWAMRLLGLKDFKLKVGLGDGLDAANLAVVTRRIGKAVAAGRCTLRVDANGAWPMDEVARRVAGLVAHGVCLVEQPATCSAAELVELSRRCELPLMADESLVTPRDAETLLEAGARVWWNIRLSKNGGLARSLALARLASRHGVPFVVGCMVGESSILSAAQRRLLEMLHECGQSRGYSHSSHECPRFVEGNYGRLALRGDLTRKSLRFGYGGTLKALSGPGLGVSIDPRKVARYGQCVRTLRI